MKTQHTLKQLSYRTKGRCLVYPNASTEKHRSDSFYHTTVSNMRVFF